MRLRGAGAELKWRGLVSEQEQSGQTVAGFCRDRGVHASQMFGWKRRFRQREETGFVEVSVSPAADGADRGQAGMKQDVLEVRLGGGRSILVGRGFDASHLRALLTVLESER